MDLLDDAYGAFTTVRVCKLFHDFGRLDLLDTSYSVDRDFEYQLQLEALECAAVHVWAKYDDCNYEQKLYYSDPAMMEYYRLCRDYSIRFGVSLKENPYMKRASEYVERMFGSRFDSSSFMYILQTKINHEHASGIVVRYLDEYFNEYFDLVEALLHIFDFYATEVKKLRAKLEQRDNNAESKTKEAA